VVGCILGQLERRHTYSSGKLTCYFTGIDILIRCTTNNNEQDVDVDRVYRRRPLCLYARLTNVSLHITFYFGLSF